MTLLKPQMYKCIVYVALYSFEERYSLLIPFVYPASCAS